MPNYCVNFVCWVPYSTSSPWSSRHPFSSQMFTCNRERLDFLSGLYTWHLLELTTRSVTLGSELEFRLMLKQIKGNFRATNCGQKTWVTNKVINNKAGAHYPEGATPIQPL